MDDLKIFAASLRQDLPTLDLHGLYPGEALEKLEFFLYTNYHKDTSVRIIYGIGKGKLREIVLDDLRKHSLVDHVVEENGACIVLFDKK